MQYRSSTQKKQLRRSELFAQKLIIIKNIIVSLGGGYTNAFFFVVDDL